MRNDAQPPHPATTTPAAATCPAARFELALAAAFLGGAMPHATGPSLHLPPGRR